MTDPANAKLGEPWIARNQHGDVGTAIKCLRPHRTIEWALVATDGLTTITIEFPKGWELVERLSAASSFAHLLPKEQKCPALLTLSGAVEYPCLLRDGHDGPHKNADADAVWSGEGP